MKMISESDWLQEQKFEDLAFGRWVSQAGREAEHLLMAFVAFRIDEWDTTEQTSFAFLKTAVL